MTKYLGMHLRSLITNPYLIFWSVLFIEFWILMWAYVFGGYIQTTEEAVRDYTATASGTLVILSLSGAAVTIAGSLLHSSKSVRYVTKYTKLSPSRFLVENLVSSVLALLVISVVMFASVVIVFTVRFGMFPLPLYPLGLVFALVLWSLFLYALAFFLNASLVVLRAGRSATFISFIPLLLGFLPYFALWVDFGNAVYVSPFNCLTSLCYYFFSGKAAPTGGFLMPGARTLVDQNIVLLSLVLWLAVLIIADVLLLRKMRGIGVEEIRAA